MSERDPWEGLLHEGETILWQGRPDSQPRIDFSRPMSLLMGGFFMIFSIVWMNMASRAGGFFWMFGLIFFCIGFYNSIGVHFRKAYLRAQTHYTLTSKRAFIATDVMGRKTLKSYPIEKSAEVELIDGPQATVTFAQQRKKTKKGYYSVPVSFEQIAEGREVYRLILSIQQAQA